jgi:hypothetical protein
VALGTEAEARDCVFPTSEMVMDMMASSAACFVVEVPVTVTSRGEIPR